MHTHQRIWRYFQRHRVVSIVVAHVVVLVTLVVLLLGNTLGSQFLGVFAQSSCSRGDGTYTVASGDTLGAIADRYNITWEHLASYNHIADANFIYIDQTVCIPGKGPVSSGPPAVKGPGNYFPYPQCTWWASQRYHQMHGVYVPWTTNSDAWLWTQRAQEFHWVVSNRPAVGDIVNLQAWVQGAYDLGHVAVVEKILGNGDVLASNLNWGDAPYQVTYVEFTPGPGISFIRY